MTSRRTASLRARLVGALIRARIRRRNWGADEQALARRARRLLGTPRYWAKARSKGLDVSNIEMGGVPAERVALPDCDDARGVVLYLHGGGYVSCSPRSHRPITAALARATGLAVLAPHYRRAPEARFPAAIDDACAAYHSLLARGLPNTRIAVAGDSAGGGLALALLVRARDEGRALPACAVAFSPWTDLTGSGASVRANDGRCAMFRPENGVAFASAYLGTAPATNPYASPLMADLSGLPPLLVQVGEEELLLDDARAFVKRTQTSGGDAQLEVYPRGVFHCWHILDGIVPEAGDALRSAGDFILSHVHSSGGRTRAHGHFRIEHGERLVARGLARLLGLPRPNAAAETRLVVTPRGEREE